MLTETAIKLVEEICYRPGWTLEAIDYSNRFEGTICVKVTYPAPETGRENWANGYAEEIRARAAFPIQIHDADATTLYRRVLAALLVIEVHEAREIFRISPRDGRHSTPTRSTECSVGARQSATLPLAWCDVATRMDFWICQYEAQYGRGIGKGQTLLQATLEAERHANWATGIEEAKDVPAWLVEDCKGGKR